jgi:hypothetical protein
METPAEYKKSWEEYVKKNGWPSGVGMPPQLPLTTSDSKFREFQKTWTHEDHQASQNRIQQIINQHRKFPHHLTHDGHWVKEI